MGQFLPRLYLSAGLDADAAGAAAAAADVHAVASADADVYAVAFGVTTGVFFSSFSQCTDLLENTRMEGVTHFLLTLSFTPLADNGVNKFMDHLMREPFPRGATPHQETIHV